MMPMSTEYSMREAPFSSRRKRCRKPLLDIAHIPFTLDAAMAALTQRLWPIPAVQRGDVAAPPLALNKALRGAFVNEITLYQKS